MKTFFKIFSLVFAVLFLWAAYLQYNDPDSLKWYAIYGLAALASILFAFDRLKFLWALFLFGFYIGFSIISWPAKFEGVTIGEGDIVNVEEGREALGLMILSLVMLMYALRIRFINKSKV